MCVFYIHIFLFTHLDNFITISMWQMRKLSHSTITQGHAWLTPSFTWRRLVSKMWILLKSRPMRTNYLRGWYKCIFLSPIPRNFNSVGLVWGLEICISKFFRWRLSMDHSWSSTDRCCILSFYILNTKCDLGIKSHPIYLIFSLLSTSPFWKTGKNQEVVKKIIIMWNFINNLTTVKQTHTINS